MFNLGTLFDKHGRLTLVASLRLLEMDYDTATEVVNEFIFQGLFRDSISVWEEAVNIACRDSYGLPGTCEPAPMSDQVMDKETDYTTISHFHDYEMNRLQDATTCTSLIGFAE